MGEIWKRQWSDFGAAVKGSCFLAWHLGIHLVKIAAISPHILFLVTISALLRLSLRLLLTAALFSTPALAAPPDAPTNFTLTWNATGLINCSWRDRSNNEVGFFVSYRTTPGAAWSNYDTLAANTTTYSNMPTGWPGCSSFEWAIRAYRGVPAPDDISISNIVTVIAPPRVTSAAYVSGNTGVTFNHQLTTACPAPVWTASPLPPGFTFNASTGTIGGTPAAVSKTTVNVTLTSGGVTVNQTLKIHIFRPVPATVAPANNTPLADRTLRRNAAATLVDLSAHFSDPDVTDASRLVFNTGTIDFLYYPEAAPATVTNFKGYISRGDFVNTIIHRSIPGFVLQGGGYKAAAGTPSIARQPAVVNEPEITNGYSTVAMAKSGGDPNSATSEYFISLANNASNLNNQNEGFAVFARVPASGMAVASNIASLCIFSFAATNGVLTDCPVTTFGPCPTPKPATPAFDAAALVKMISAGPVAPLSYAVQSSAPLICGAAVNAGQLTLTPLAAGTATITVTATDLDSLSISRSFNVTVEEHLADWLAAQNFPNGSDATATADPDKDNGQNIMEFGLMTNPQSPTPVPVPPSGLATIGADQFLTLSFPVRKLTGSGFLYTVESQNGLTGAWTPAWTSANGFAHAQVVSFTDLPDRTNVTIRDTQPIAPGAIRFIRLRGTDTP